MGLNDPDPDGHPVRLELAGGVEHREGLADPCAGAEENLQLSAFGAMAFIRRDLQKCVGIGSLIFHGRQ